MRFLLVVLLVAPVVAAQPRVFHVTNAADSGPGSLREAMLGVLEQCPGSCVIRFQIPDATTPWVTIRPLLPLPPLRATLDGRNQTKVYGDTNPRGPEIELNGELAGPGVTGLLVQSGGSVTGLTINGFGGPGIHLTGNATIEGNFIGCDPTASRTIPNERGIVIHRASIPMFTGSSIRDNVISGNRRAGIFAWSDSNPRITRNRIEWNGASGIFMGPNVTGAYIDDNHIAFNGHAGISVAGGGPREVEMRRNALHANNNLAIDYVLDGVSRFVDGTSGPVHSPEITSARYDPVTDTTVVEGFQRGPRDGFTTRLISFFANDAPDPSGFGEGQYPLGDFPFASFNSGPDPAFSVTVKGKPPGRWITATVTMTWHYYWSRNPRAEGNEQGVRTTTSEFGRTVEILNY